MNMFRKGNEIKRSNREMGIRERIKGGYKRKCGKGGVEKGEEGKGE